MRKQADMLPSLFLKGLSPRHSRMIQNQQSLLLFTVKFYFWGIAAISLYSNVVRMGSKLVKIQWKSHYCVHMLGEKMLAPGQIKCLLLNGNGFVGIFVWKCGTEGWRGGEAWEQF